MESVGLALDWRFPWRLAFMPRATGARPGSVPVAGARTGERPPSPRHEASSKWKAGRLCAASPAGLRAEGPGPVTGETACGMAMAGPSYAGLQGVTLCFPALSLQTRACRMPVCLP